LTAGALEKNDHALGDRPGDVAAVVAADERKREVDPRGDAGGSPDVAIPDEDGIDLDANGGKKRLEEVARRPMRDRTLAVEETRGAENKGAAAYGAYAACFAR